jgi:hypothetical protein
MTVKELPPVAYQAGRLALVFVITAIAALASHIRG